MEPLRLGLAEQEAADAFQSCGCLVKQFGTQREDAKRTLVEALGEHLEGILPDGRRVSKVISSFEEATITRRAYVSVTLVVSPAVGELFRNALKVSCAGGCSADEKAIEATGKRSRGRGAGVKR